MPTLILNVDDNEPNRYVKTRVLKAAGFEVVEAGTGGAALEMVASRHPDLVLLDIRLPDMSGLEVCKRIKSDPRTAGLPVIHISATFVTPKDEATSLGAGADIYLAEPVGPQELASAVRTMLKLRATETGLAAAEQRLRLATEGAGIATWDLDLGSGSSVWSRQFYEMLGYDAKQVPSWDAWLQRVRESERASVAAALETAMMGEGTFSREHWIVRADNGKERCIAPFGRIHAESPSAPARLIGVAIDVTERRQAERERESLLSQARTAQRVAEESVRLKDEFLAVLSHELRNPMSAMMGWLHLMRSGRLSTEQQGTALATIERNARLQTQLINDLLDVSRIVTGKMEIDWDAVLVDEALANALETARPAAEAKRIELSLQAAPGSSVVRGSPDRLQQVFSNLLSNALKFTPSGGRVEVVLERGEHDVKVKICDNGEGIAGEMLPFIFDRFRQADSSDQRRHGGLGLGLAIVKSLVEIHKGSVSADSKGTGQGACFAVTLPLLEATRVDEALGARTAASAESLKDVRVLVVDDDPDALHMIEELLRFSGAFVRSANGATAALKAANGWHPHVLVLDIGMPETNGYELLAQLRRNLSATAETLPAVALTGFASESDAARALAAHFQAHVAKPFQPEGLLRLIARLATK